MAYVYGLSQCPHMVDFNASDVPIPKGLAAALRSAHAEFWLTAIYKEYSSIIAHDVFEVIRRSKAPHASNIMNCHLLFDVKSHKDGSVERFKARLVAGGNSQTEGVDFEAIFATVMKLSTFRMALHLAAVRDYNITGIDVSTAFLYGDIDRPVYMRMPPGLPRYDADGYELICRLKKSLYGLRQAPRIWYEHFVASLVASGCRRSDARSHVCLSTLKDRLLCTSSSGWMTWLS